MNERDRIDRAREREREREREKRNREKIGQRQITRRDNPISVPTSLNPEKFHITFER